MHTRSLHAGPRSCPCRSATASPASRRTPLLLGNTGMAKHYGRLHMFVLRRAGDGKGPPVLGDIERAAG